MRTCLHVCISAWPFVCTEVILLSGVLAYASLVNSDLLAACTEAHLLPCNSVNLFPKHEYSAVEAKLTLCRCAAGVPRLHSLL